MKELVISWPQPSHHSTHPPHTPHHTPPAHTFPPSGHVAHPQPPHPHTQVWHHHPYHHHTGIHTSMRVGFRTSSLADYHEAVGEHKQRAQRLMAFASRSQKNGCLHSTSKSFQHTIPTSPTKPATAKIRSMLIQLGLTMAAQQNQQVRQQQQQRQQRQTWSHPARHPQRQRQQLWSPAPGQQQRVLPRTGFESFAQTTTASFQTPQRAQD